MSTQAKYGWAVGLIVIGVVFALPFRNVAKSESTLAAAHESSHATTNSVASTEGEDSSTPRVDHSAGAIQHGALAKSNLLPNSTKVLEQFDQVERLGSEGKIVEQVPNRLNLHEGDSALNRGEQGVASQDRAATLQPVEFSNQQPIRRMAESSGPYRMKPVPSSRFIRASQSSGKPVFSNASRSRKVIQYRLRDGDSLRTIAARYLGDENRYSEILADNRHILTNGENFLPVGQFITIIVQ